MSERILIVDDEEQARRLLCRILEAQGHVCEEAANAEDARRKLLDRPFALVLCDMSMPGESGLELLRETIARDPSVAAIMVTGLDDPDLAELAVNLGAYGYVIKPFNRSEILISVVNALRRRTLEAEQRDYQAQLERRVVERTTALREAVDRLERATQELRRSREETVQRLASAVEYRSRETGEHITRMSRYSAGLAEALGLDAERVELIRVASPMHDVGKIGIPDAVLLKPASLSREERRLMESHTEIGHDILAPADGEHVLALAAAIAWTHHERWDGSGYPRGLAREEIPLEGRIVAVADVFDALTSERTYRDAWPLDHALEYMRAQRGAHFDPAVLNAFLSVGPGLLDLGLPAAT
jgi:putative two-component system response regulator